MNCDEEVWCEGKEWKNLAFLVFIESGHGYKSGHLIKKLTCIEKMDNILQNPLKSCDFERISRFYVILIGFCLFIGFCCWFESLKLSKVTKSWILGLKSRFWQQ